MGSPEVAGSPEEARGAQNPGLSVFSSGSKLLVELPTPDADPARISLPGGPRHNEIRTVLADSPGRWFGGHEDGPVMHTATATCRRSMRRESSAVAR